MRKAVRLLLLVSWYLMFSEHPVHAYLDPGSGSMFLQIVLGGVAGVAVIVKLYWRRLLGLFGNRDDHDKP